MRKLGGHYRSSPGAAIMVENDIRPAAARLNERQSKNLVKLLKKPGHPLGKAIQRKIRILEEEKQWNRKGATKKTGTMRGMARLGQKIKGRWKEIQKRRKGDARNGKKWESEGREKMEI